MVKGAKQYIGSALLFAACMSLYCRPLLYGLSMVQNFTVVKSYEFESNDYWVTPNSPWNYALRLSSNPENSDMDVTIDGIRSGLPPFSQEGAPVKIVARVRPHL